MGRRFRQWVPPQLQHFQPGLQVGHGNRTGKRDQPGRDSAEVLGDQAVPLAAMGSNVHARRHGAGRRGLGDTPARCRQLEHGNLDVARDG